MSARTPGADERFAAELRGPYWRPGHSLLVEPWMVVAETNLGQMVIPCGADQARARTLADRWESLADQHLPISTVGQIAVGAAVVDPHGSVVHAWGSTPVVGGPGRWAPLERLLADRECRGCRRPLWPGCWVLAEGDGCSACAPEVEADDARVWPPEPEPPTGDEPESKRRASRSRKPVRVPEPDPDGQTSLLAHRTATG